MPFRGSCIAGILKENTATSINSIKSIFHEVKNKKIKKEQN